MPAAPATPAAIPAIAETTLQTIAQMNRATQITLGVGYALAVPGLLLIYRALRDPEGRTLGIPNRAIIVAELLGSGAVTTAWFVAGYRQTNIVNTLWVLACTTFWIRAENKIRLAGKRADHEGTKETKGHESGVA